MTTKEFPERLESNYIAWTNVFYTDGHSDDLREVAIEAARRWNAHEQMREALQKLTKYRWPQDEYLGALQEARQLLAATERPA